MSELSGYECDACKRHASTREVDVSGPGGWYAITMKTGWRWPEFHFCSRECLEKWVGAGSVPESKKALFKKLVKALVGV